MIAKNRFVPWRSVICVATTLAVLAGACSSSVSDDPDGPQETVAPTTLGAPTTQVALTPDLLRNAFVGAIASRDAGGLRALWPTTSWEAIGTEVLADFEPASDNGDCELLSETRAHCFVFQQDLPFVLGLTMERSGAGSWSIVSVSLDSTN